MRQKNFNTDELIESLNGTCMSIDEVLPDGMMWEDLTTKDHEEIDDAIFCCESCGWWWDASEAVEDINGDEKCCPDCANQ